MTELELLIRHTPSIRRLAYKLAGLNFEIEDLIQEAAIALLVAHRQSGHTDAAWLHRCVSNHLHNVIDRATIQRKGGAGERKTFTDTRKAISVGPIAPADAEWMDTRRYTSPEGADLAYHRREIATVLNDVVDGLSRDETARDRLTAQQRAYVIHRFWGDLQGAELSVRLGLAPRSSTSAVWSRTRAKLATRLAHLAPEVAA